MSSASVTSDVLKLLITISTLFTACTSYPSRLIVDTQHQFNSQLQHEHLQQQQQVNRAPSTWSSVFIPSEFNIYNRRISPSSSFPHLPSSSIQFTNSIQNFESNFNLLNSGSSEVKVEESVEDIFLTAMDDISRGTRCHSTHLHKDVVQTSNQRYLTLPTKVRRLSDKVASIWREKYKDTSMRTSLVSSILSGYEPNNDGYKLLRTSIDQLVALDGSFFRARVAWFKAANNNKISSRSSLIADYLISLEPKRRISSESYNTSISISEPWLRPSSNIGKKNQFYERLLREANVHIGPSAFTREELIFADWSPIYYSCELRKWLMSFSTLIIGEVAQNVYTIRGLISVDIDVTNTDFNQCNSDVFTSINKVSLSSNTGNSAATGTTGGDQQAVTGTSVLVNLPGSHKCEETSSLCIFHPGLGWKQGGYKCVCKNNYYSTIASIDDTADARPYFNGTMVETAWKNKQRHRGLAYGMIYTCQRCHISCTNGCIDDTPCDSGTDWLTSQSFVISIFLSLIILSFLLYYLLSHRAKYRREI